jgi:uncharacterized protein
MSMPPVPSIWKEDTMSAKDASKKPAAKRHRRTVGASQEARSNVATVGALPDAGSADISAETGPQVIVPDPDKIDALIRRLGDDHLHDEFDTPMARAFGRYCSPLKPVHEDGNRDRTLTLYRLGTGDLWPSPSDEHAEPWAQTVHDMLRSHITGQFFPCLGARGAFAHCSYRVGYYQEMAHPSAVAAMGRDLRRFVNEYRQLGEFCSFVSLYKYPQSTSEDQFEELLFKHLQMLHDADRSPWDPNYSPDPDNPKFAFSFAGCAFFIVGMHSGSSRLSRGLWRPALIFNPESQIRRLQETGLIDKFAENTRTRDIRYQGSINPSLPADYKTTGGEARVYSGKKHPEGTHWKCPFHPRPDLLESSGSS